MLLLAYVQQKHILAKQAPHSVSSSDLTSVRIHLQAVKAQKEAVMTGLLSCGSPE